MVFKTILEFGDGGFKSSKLLFPSLIYGILESQGFIRDINEELSNVSDLLKISPSFFNDNRKIDLPLSESHVAPDVSAMASSSDFIQFTSTHLYAHIYFSLKQII